MGSVLVVEDDPDLRDMLNMAFEQEGYAVSATPSGREAVVMAGRTPFDLVVLDLDLEELSGDAVLRVIDDLGGAPVIATSGRGGTWEPDLIEHGASACLRKPFSMSHLLALADRLSDGHAEPSSGWPADVRRLSADDLNRIARLPDQAVDELPFGAIALDREGRIASFNAFEAQAAECHADAVIGMRFSELAPCTMVQEFTRAMEAAQDGTVGDAVIRFVFPRHGAQALVSVRIFRDEAHDRVWLFVSQRS